MKLLKTALGLAGLIFGFFLLLYWATISGDESRRPEVSAAEIKRLKEAWLEKDIEYFECSKELGTKYRYPEVAALRASMCTAISTSISKIGEEWTAPLIQTSELPAGFTLIEDETI